MFHDFHRYSSKILHTSLQISNYAFLHQRNTWLYLVTMESSESEAVIASAGRFLLGWIKISRASRTPDRGADFEGFRRLGLQLGAAAEPGLNSIELSEAAGWSVVKGRGKVGSPRRRPGRRRPPASSLDPDRRLAAAGQARAAGMRQSAMAAASLIRRSGSVLRTDLWDLHT